MTGTNNFLNFASAATNIMSQTDYAALPDLTAGSSSGIVASAKWNKMFRQSLAMSNLIGSFIAAQNYNAIDDGNAANLLTAFENALTAFITSDVNIRTRLSGSTTYYVTTTGNDSTGNGTSGSPWLTIQHAINYIAQSVDTNGQAVIINVAAGTYSAGGALTAPLVGGGSLTIHGDTTTPDNVIISTTTSNPFSANNNAIFNVEGFKLTTTSAHAILCDTGGKITVTGKMDFGSIGSGSTHIVAQNAGSEVQIAGSVAYTISGGGACHFQCTGNAVISLTTSNAVTVSGTPNFGQAFAQVANAGVLFAFGQTYTGSATGTRYNVITNGVANTNSGGSTYFPGNASGTTATGGQYV